MISPRNVLFPPAIVALYVASVPAPALASEPVTVRGRIGQINAAAGQLTLEPVGGRNVVLTVTAHSRLEARGKATPLVRFDKGQWLRATYFADGEANEIVLLKTAIATDEELGRKLKQARVASEGYTFRQKEKYKGMLRESIDDVSDRLDHLRAEARDAEGTDRSRILARISAIRYRRATLTEMLAEVTAATAPEWSAVKGEVGAAVADLEKLIGVPNRD